MKLRKRVVRSLTALGTVLALTVNVFGVQAEAASASDAAVLTVAGAGTYTVLSEQIDGLTDSTDGVSSLLIASVSESESSASGDATATTDASADAAAEAYSQDWTNRVMANVDDYVNVRAKANTDSEIVGRLSKGDAAKILKTKGNWTKIKSGNVTGWVCNDYLAFGDDAAAIAAVEGTYKAIVKTETLRVRADASTDAEIVGLLSEGDRLNVATDAQEVDGWVAVEYEDETCYVSAEYVKVKFAYGTASTMEEVAQEEISDYEYTLLAAIIMCEAGGESYEGQVAVGSVVLNRVNSSSYPDTITDVVYQSGQFSPVSNGALSSVLSSGAISDSCYEAATAALLGSSPVGDALSFCRVGGASGTVIGNHVFY